MYKVSIYFKFDNTIEQLCTRKYKWSYYYNSNVVFLVILFQNLFLKLKYKFIIISNSTIKL